MIRPTLTARSIRIVFAPNQYRPHACRRLLQAVPLSSSVNPHDSKRIRKQPCCSLTHTCARSVTLFGRHRIHIGPTRPHPISLFARRNREGRIRGSLVAYIGPKVGLRIYFVLELGDSSAKRGRQPLNSGSLGMRSILILVGGTGLPHRVSIPGCDNGIQVNSSCPRTSIALKHRSQLTLCPISVSIHRRRPVSW